MEGTTQTSVFGAVRRFASQPIRLFRIVAAVALLMSFLPDLWLLTDTASRTFPGATVQAVGTLMVPHIVAATTVVWMLDDEGFAEGRGVTHTVIPFAPGQWLCGPPSARSLRR